MFLSNLKTSISHSKIRQIIGFLYLCVLIVFVSFYFTTGYWDIGEDKYKIFMSVSKIGIPLWIFGLAVDVAISQNKGVLFFVQKINSFDSKEWFLVLFLVAAIVSTLTSYYREISIWGFDGWHMGLATQSIMVIIYIIQLDIASGIDEYLYKGMLYLMLLVSAIVFLLGILNRFSIYPFSMYGQAEDYISTLGNINWYCGYWSIWAGLGSGWFLIVRDVHLKKIMAGYVWLISVAGISCGSSSAYLAWGAISLVSFLICTKSSEAMINWAYLEIIALLALPTLRLLGLVRPNRMWYDSAWLKGVCYGHLWFMPWFVSTALCCLMIYLCKKRNKDRAYLRAPIIGCICGGFLAIVIILILNSVIEGGIWPVRGSGFFTWRSGWGNGRGGIWTTVVMLIGELSPYTMIFGVGCDCLCPYLYEISDLSWRIMRIVGDLYLTNAHNEMLTMLVNEGVFGLVVYVGLIVSHAKEGLVNCIEKPELLLPLLACSAYVAVGLVGFMQILSTPFFFMMLGMLSGLIKRDTLNIMY